LRRETSASCDGTVALVDACGTVQTVELDATVRSTDTRACYRMDLVLSTSDVPGMLMRTLHRLSWTGGGPEC
jgi:hypothetical protein